MSDVYNRPGYWCSESSDDELMTGMFVGFRFFFLKSLGCIKNPLFLRTIFCSDLFGGSPDVSGPCLL